MQCDCAWNVLSILVPQFARVRAHPCLLSRVRAGAMASCLVAALRSNVFALFRIAFHVAMLAPFAFVPCRANARVCVKNGAHFHEAHVRMPARMPAWRVDAYLPLSFARPCAFMYKRLATLPTRCYRDSALCAALWSRSAFALQLLRRTLIESGTEAQPMLLYVCMHIK